MEVRSLFLILLSNFSNREISLKEILFPSNVIFSSARVSVIGNRYISIGSLRRWIIFPLENISPPKNPFYPRYALINNIKITRIHPMRSSKSIDAMLALLAQLRSLEKSSRFSSTISLNERERSSKPFLPSPMNHSSTLLVSRLEKSFLLRRKRGNNPSYLKWKTLTKTVSRSSRSPIPVILTCERGKRQDRDRADWRRNRSRRRETISGRRSLRCAGIRRGQSVSPCRRIDFFRVVAGLDRISSGIEVVSGRDVIPPRTNYSRGKRRRRDPTIASDFPTRVAHTRDEGVLDEKKMYFSNSMDYARKFLFLS